MILIYDDFKKLYEHKTITGAAAYLRISKQALSKAIKRCGGYYIRKKRWRIVDNENPLALGLFYLDLLRYFWDVRTIPKKPLKNYKKRLRSWHGRSYKLVRRLKKRGV